MKGGGEGRNPFDLQYLLIKANGKRSDLEILLEICQPITNHPLVGRKFFMKKVQFSRNFFKKGHFIRDFMKKVHFTRIVMNGFYEDSST